MDVGGGLDFVLGGTQALSIAPLAREAHVSLASAWPHPRFEGDFLPRTQQARSLVRNQAVLAHVTVTILITLGVSVVVTALG